ncbi:MAG TPA: DUF4340 domain-containing protein [Gemmataceae bacterium]|jgi:hypothetical protein
MNFKTTYILFGILAVVLALIAYALFVGPSPTDTSDWVLPSIQDKGPTPLPTKDIDRVEIERNRPDDQKTKIVLVREGDVWKITEPREYRADRIAVEDVIRQVHDARRDKRSDAANKPSQYGLEPPAVIITLKKEKEPQRQVTLNVGDISPGEASAVVYVNSSDRPKEVMAVAKKELDKTLGGLDDFRARDLLSPSTGDIQQFTLTQQSKDKIVKGPIELKKGSEERWSYVQPNYGDAQASGTDPAATDKAPSNVQSVLTDISNLRVESAKDFVKEDATDLGKYNLDPAKDDLLRIEIERVDEIATSEEGKKEKKTSKVALVVGVGKKVDDKRNEYYAYLDDSKHKDIVKVPAKNVERFLKLLEKPDALRDRNLVALRGQPDAIDIKTDSWGLLEFRRTSSSAPGPRGLPAQASWKLWRGDKSYAVDENAVQNLISLLTAPNQIEGFVDDAAEKGKLRLDKPDAVVSIWSDSLPAEDKKKDDKKDDKKDGKKDKKPEPKDKTKPAFTLSFGGLSEGKVAVERKRGDEKRSIIVLVPGKVRDQVLEGPLAYLDKQLPSFNSDRFDLAMKNVTKLTLTRDGTTYEISRDKPESPWKIEKPADYAGRTADRRAVEDILRNLNTLRAVMIVDDKAPSDAKLTEWGLKDPRLKAAVTVTKDGKTTTYEYAFGKEASDKTGTYLRTSQQDMVSIVPDLAVKTLERELLDPTVFKFDASKVKEVKLTGWIELQKKLLGKNAPQKVLAFKRQGGGWESVPKDSFKLDANRLEDFLKSLSNLQAVKFVAHKAKPTDAHGLDVAKDDALKIELTLEGEKEPLTLTVGKPDGDNYFAISNKLSGDIFDVRKNIFEKAKAAPAYFSGQ